MNVHRSTPATPHGIGVAEPVADDLDLDAVDAALDRGDLETVRRLLGYSRCAWRALLARL
jgi:hypothetical protein